MKRYFSTRRGTSRTSLLMIVFTLLLSTFPWPGSSRADDLAYDDGKRRDPFIPLLGKPGASQAKASSTDVALGGIIFDPAGGSIVVLNGDSYREGDQVGEGGDLTVISIFKDRVILKQSSEEKTLWIREEVVDDISQENKGA